MTNDSINVPDSAKLPWSGLGDEALLKVASFIGLHCVETDVDIEDVPFMAMGAVLALNAMAFCTGKYGLDDSGDFDRRASTFHDAIVSFASAKDKISSDAISRQIHEAFRNGDVA